MPITEQVSSRRLLRLPEVRQRVGLSRTEIYRRIRRGDFPAAVPLGQRASAWDSVEVDRWIAERVAERDTEAAR